MRCSIFWLVQVGAFNVSVLWFLYECETWSLTLREERRLRVFENRVLRRVRVWNLVADIEGGTQSGRAS
jgi:hypothetical protein